MSIKVFVKQAGLNFENPNAPNKPAFAIQTETREEALGAVKNFMAKRAVEGDHSGLTFVLTDDEGKREFVHY